MKFPDRLTYEEIEDRALQLLLDFGKGQLPPAPIPVQYIAESHLRLILVITDPSEYGFSKDVLGAIFFNDNEVFINEALVTTKGRINFTVAHEIGHDRMHREVVDPLEYLKPLLKLPSKSPGILCRDGDRSIIEVQANIYAACLLMPRPLVIDAVDQVARHQGIHHDGVRYLYTRSEKVKFIGALAEVFEVSREAMQYRLEQLNLAVEGTPNQMRLF